jgi:hypothetical protein
MWSFKHHFLAVKNVPRFWGLFLVSLSCRTGPLRVGGHFVAGIPFLGTTSCLGPPVGREALFYACFFGTVLKRLMKPSDSVGWVRMMLWTAEKGRLADIAS